MNKVIIIAEAGVNHNGDMNKAKALIDVAAQAKVDYIKFQSFKAKKLVSPDAPKAAYQKQNFQDGDNNQFKMLKRLELSLENHKELIRYCNLKGVNFLSTAFDEEGLEFLDELGVDCFKIPSGEITNFPYLQKLTKFEKPIILSTGMSNMLEIGAALNVLEKKYKRSDITVLHCNTEYPTPMKHVNLKAMLSIKKNFNVEVGYSDHTLGIEVPIAAVAMGAKVIEKHFTLDRNLPGPDHKASLEPDELIAMVKAIRNIEFAMSGDGVKKASSSEYKNINIARKSIHINKPLKAGSIIREADLIALRPGDGISPMEWNNIIGRRLINDCIPFHKIKWSDFK